MTSMPSTYTSSHTTTQSSPPEIRLRLDYIKTIPGILKIVEVVASIITFICASVVPWGYLGAGWVQFVSISAFITALIWFIFYLIGVIYRFPGPWILIEFIYYCVFTLFFLIAAIVSAARAHAAPSIGAAAFFAFVCTAVFAVDTFFQFRAWRTGQTEMTTTTTTTTHTSSGIASVETKTEY